MAKTRKTYRNVITSPEILAEINPENLKLAKRYLKNLATKSSPATVKNYKSDLNIFFSWNYLENDNIPFTDIKKLEMQDFFDYAVTELKWKSSRYARMHSVLSELSKFIEKFYDDVYPNFRNIVKFVDKLPKEVAREKSVFTKEEMDHLMSELDKEGLIDEKCLLALALYSGARVSELVRFKVDSIDENNTAFDGLFLETTEEIKVKGRGVNGKKIHKYIIKDLFLPYYYEYLPIREEIMKKNGKEHNMLFVQRDGSPATVFTIRGWMDKWDRYLDKHWYPHSARHHFVTTLSMIGLEVELIQAICGWVNSDLVSIYNDQKASERSWKGLAKLKDALEENKEK